MLNFDFLKKGLEKFLHHILCMIFPEKCFSSYILLADQISFSGCLGNMCIAIVYFPRCDVIIFEISFIFLFKPFFYMTQRSRQKFKYLENEKSF